MQESAHALEQVREGAAQWRGTLFASSFAMESDLQRARTRMVTDHLTLRGIAEPHILAAFRSVPREKFVAPELAEFAYEDTPLAIPEGQTISQPYVVALTIQALRLRGDEHVLEIGTGSGYAAALLSRLARQVYTVERVESLAVSARARLVRLGYDNVECTCADGSLGWKEHAPYDAIAVAAGGPKVPPALLSQLAIGGRLVIPVGPKPSAQVLMCITRISKTEYQEENLGEVRFVRLIGEQAWSQPASPPPLRGPAAPRSHSSAGGLAALVREAAEPMDDLETASLDALLERIGNARVVLIGEATHGTSEFYRMRARITRELIARKGFRFVAAEADWPDAQRIDEYVLGGPRRSTLSFAPFARFPRWMWRNHEVHEFVDWLRDYNMRHAGQQPGFHGLDLYSMFTSIAAVLSYLDQVDPEAAKLARRRYGSMTPWQHEPFTYGKDVLAGRAESSEGAVVAMLSDMLQRELAYAQKDGVRFFDAVQNAQLIADAERYYRAMYYGSTTSWNLRDTHMFETLRSLLTFYGPDAKGVVWEHNSHVGDASATEMNARGQHNVGQLCRTLLREQTYIIGFGTDHGTVAAASDWGDPVQRLRVVPACEGSYERIFHESGVRAGLLHLREPARREVRDELLEQRLERAIGVVYRPKTELQSHYFHASLPRQFDEYIWIDETRALRPLEEAPRLVAGTVPDTYPFGTSV
jgi:protein-L-isoaspartate(D-aspartate) O-methyltransferase